MGQPKPLLALDGHPLVRLHVRKLSLRAQKTIVVVGHQASRVAAVVAGLAEVVINPDWETTWPADSLHLALQAYDVDGPCWVTPVDTPPARLETLDALLAAGPPAVPTDALDRPGHPVLLDRQLVTTVRRAAPEGGLRPLLRSAHRVRVADPQVSIDFDDAAAWRRFRDARGGS